MGLVEVGAEHDFQGAARLERHAGVEAELLDLVFDGHRVAWDLDVEACGWGARHRVEFGLRQVEERGETDGLRMSDLSV